MTDAGGNIVGESRFYPFGETRFTTGSIFTDKLFTGQREMAGLGIYHYQARFYSPYVNHFLQPDTIVPDYTNPQNLNRYAYVLNNPVRYTDPTGHCVEADFGICMSVKQVTKREKLEKLKNKNKNNDSQNDSIPFVTNTPTPISNGTNSRDDECNTVTCRAFKGDLSAIADLLIPTHVGWRGQFELSATLLQIFPGIGAGPSGTLGANIAYNRVSGEFATFANWTLEGGGSVGTPIGAALTEGPIVGWGSSTISDVAQGNSGTISGTAAYEGALSVSISAPVDGDSLSTIRPHVDPIYGQIPATVYVGGGIGGAYAGAGGGGTHVFASATIDLFP